MLGTSVDLSKLEIGDIIFLSNGTHHVVSYTLRTPFYNFQVETESERLFDGEFSTLSFHNRDGSMTGERNSGNDIVAVIKKEKSGIISNSSMGIEMYNMNSDELEKAKMHVIQSGYDENMNGKHYKRGGIESIEVIEAWELGFNLGNVIKYLSRAGVKTSDALPCLKKARWYIDREICNREKNNDHKI